MNVIESYLNLDIPNVDIPNEHNKKLVLKSKQKQQQTNAIQNINTA